MADRTKKRTAEAPTIYDVAETAGVSIVTVSRVFNDYPHVSAKMKARVLAAAGRIGFSPKLVAKPKRLALIIGHLNQLHGGGYKMQMLMRLIGYASRRGYAVEFVPAENIELAVQRSVNGVIEFGLTSDEIHCLKKLPDIPIVLINKEVSRPKRWSTICSDHEGEGRMATEYLLKRGHERIALVLDEESGWSADQRRSGHVDAMKAGLGKTCPLTILSAASRSPAQIMDNVLRQQCTALVNLSDNAGMSLFGELRNHRKIDIPGELSVISLEHDSVSAHLSPPMTTVEQPLQTLAEAAISGLLSAIDGGGESFHQSFPSRLNERESVRSLH